MTFASPAIEMLTTLAADRTLSVPSIVSSRFEPLRRSVIVCALPPVVVEFHAVGGDGPLPLFAAGSVDFWSVPAGVDVEPLDWVLEIVVWVVALVPLEDVPAPAVVPFTFVVCWSLPVVEEMVPLVEPVVVVVVVDPAAAPELVSTEPVPSVPVPPVPPVICWLCVAPVPPPSVPVSLVPIVAVVELDDVSGGVCELVLAGSIESTWNSRLDSIEFGAGAAEGRADGMGIPSDGSRTGVADVSGVAGSVAVAAAAVSVACAGAAGWAGRPIGTPMLSSTTAAFANGSLGVVVFVPGARRAWAWLSETTGTRLVNALCASRESGG